jgi:hypothetical protein
VVKRSFGGDSRTGCASANIEENPSPDAGLKRIS